MAAFNKFNSFAQYLGSGVIKNDTDQFKVYLTNTAPVATNSVKTDVPEIAAGGGYSAGGNICPVTSWGQSGGVGKLVLADPAIWTATGSVATFRYAVLYDDTPTSPADPLVGWWDYGAAVNLTSGETFAVDLDQANGVYTIT